jgi:hypothetical protein
MWLILVQMVMQVNKSDLVRKNHLQLYLTRLEYKKYIANQVQNTDVDAVHFSEGKYIDKFLVDCKEEVLKYLKKFDNIDNLKSLEECLDKNRINHSTLSNDFIYVENLFLHFLFLYQNDVLTQPLIETELTHMSGHQCLEMLFLERLI